MAAQYRLFALWADEVRSFGGNWAQWHLDEPYSHLGHEDYHCFGHLKRNQVDPDSLPPKEKPFGYIYFHRIARVLASLPIDRRQLVGPRPPR